MFRVRKVASHMRGEHLERRDGRLTLAGRLEGAEGEKQERNKKKGRCQREY
jgi:hypothetical protein